MIVLGIDPGLELSHAAILRRTPGPATAYGCRAHLIGTRAGTPEHLTIWAAEQRAHLVLVEVARGSVASKRDNDPVLHINIVAGELLGRLRAAGLPAVPVASGGAVTAWNWRSMIGVTGSGADTRDDAVTGIIRVRVENHDEIPTGSRGGHLSHYWDAAGVALSGMDRADQLPTLTPLGAALHVTPIEQAKLHDLRASKQARKLKRQSERA